MTMIRKLILGTASILVLGIGGAALDFSADADNVPNAVETSAPGTSHHWINAANLSKDDIRWAQVELHDLGLYNGSLDGAVGPETERALLDFQKSNGLERTGTLDQQTRGRPHRPQQRWPGIQHAAKGCWSCIHDKFLWHERYKRKRNKDPKDVVSIV
jgi:peptidoglycan hydrolase-like protein with peptidoglycan-binding domain